MLFQRNLFALLAVAIVTLGAWMQVTPAASAAPASVEAPVAKDNPNAQNRRLQFDVAEDMTRFIFDQDVVYEDGLPADGSSFITRGYLYEYGTLDGGNGVNPDGSPEFPDEVIGEWICSGYMINDAGHATGGVWVFSTQFFQLGDEAGAQTIVTTGYELADVDVAIARAITGGTGDFKTARGESTQTLLGLNASEGVNLRVDFVVQK
jgi:hypothetical protein